MESKEAARQKLLKRYGHYYRRFGYRRDGLGKVEDKQSCAYCGTLADSQDHVPPLRWVYALGAGFFDSSGIPFIIVPACQECNSELGARRVFTLNERARYLLGRYLVKHKRFLQNIRWMPEELDELGQTLRSKIEPFAICQLAIDRRIQILEESLRRPTL